MVYLELFHGRHSPNEELDGWGFEGPVLGPFPFIHITYGTDIKLAGAYYDSLGFDKDGYVQFRGAYYGDISTFSEPQEHDFSTKELLQRIKETQEVFLTDPVLLVGDKREWVKLYCEWRLKNDAGKLSTKLYREWRRLKNDAGKHSPDDRTRR